MTRQIFAISIAVVMLLAPTMVRAQSETLSYSDTMRKHGKSAVTAHAPKHSAPHMKGEKASSGGKKSHGRKG